MTTFGCSGNTEPPPIRLGHVATLSGPGRDAGQQASLGIRLALLQQANSKKYKLTRPLAVHHTDAKDNPLAFEAEAIRLTTVNRVIGLLGGDDGEEVKALDSSSVPIATPLGYRVPGLRDDVYCLGLSPEAKGKLVADFLAASFPKYRLTIVVDERNPAFVRTVEVLAKRWKESTKSTSIHIIRFTNKPNEKSEVLEEGENVVVFVSEISEFRMRCSKVPGSELVCVFAGPEISRSRIARDPAFEDRYWATAFSPDAKQTAKSSFVKQFRKTFAKDPDAHAALAYDATWLFIEGLRRCEGRYTAKDLQLNLAKIKEITTVTGKATFDDDHCLQRSGFIVHLRKGSWTVWEPASK